MTNATSIRVAAAQVRPVWGRAAKTAEVAAEWIGRAAAEGCGLVAFGETFLSGYPCWLSSTGGAAFNDPDQKAAYAYYLDMAVELEGPEVATVVEASRDHGVFSYVGITERGTGTATGTVYATLLAIHPEDGLVGAHRKLRPTYEERLVWGPGDGHGLRVHRGPGGVPVGGLNCWENWMPQARHAMYAGGEHLHVSVWPGSSRLTRDITRFVALEGRVFSLAAGTLLSLEDIPDDFPLRDRLTAEAVSFDGGSAIAAPDGTWIVEPVSGEEGLVVADLDLSMVGRERQNFDPTGHYSRPDVFEVTVDRRRREAARFVD